MNSPRRLLPALCALLLAGSAAAQVGAGGYVQDEAGLFGLAAVQDADQRLATLREKTHVAFWIRTVKQLPDALVKALDEKGGRSQALAFKQFALEQAQKEGRDGIYALISTAPKHKLAVVVVTSPEVEKLFREPEQIRRIFATSRLDTNPDAPLKEAVDKVEYLLFTRSDETTIGWPLIGAIACGLIGVWLLLGLIRMKLTQPQPGGEPETPQRRNSLMGGMLGGLFGAVAGHWIYDTLFDRDKADRPPETPAQEEAALDQPIEAEAPADEPR